MKDFRGLRWSWILLALGLLLGAGCKRAGRFGQAPASKSKPARERTAQDKQDKKEEPPPKKKKPPSAPPGFAWLEPTAEQRKEMAAEVPIKFIHEGTDPERWNKLKQFWTLVSKPDRPEGKAGEEIHIKVPLGLDDPTPYIPRSNPPTAGKWELGKMLFFDENYLSPVAPVDQRSCARCHRPEEGFSGVTFRGAVTIKAPTLLNSVYNAYQFWNGRVTSLEEVVQRSLKADEPEPPKSHVKERSREAERRHRWLGVVDRLRADRDYPGRFRKVFGTLPTQDNVGKALATYLRTMLAGNSLHDRARKAARGKIPQEKEYLPLLDDAALKALKREKSTKAEVANELVLGSSTFRGQGRCARCHTGPNFTDNDFHNTGVHESRDKVAAGKEPGRFAVLPIGLKDARMIGAYKTPTLRNLSQATVFFHAARSYDKTDNLLESLTFYARKDFRSDNPYLDPELRDPSNPNRRRDLKLENQHIHALALFLHSLDGKVDEVVSDPKARPEGAGSFKP